MESKKRKSEGAPPRQLKLKSLFAAVELEEKTAEIEDEEPLLISTVVPHSWLIENRSRVRWPSHLPTDVISNYVMRRVTPKDHWGTFKVMKVIPLASDIIPVKRGWKRSSCSKRKKTVPPVLLQREATENGVYVVKPHAASSQNPRGAKRIKFSTPPQTQEEDSLSADESTDYETLLLSQAKFAVMRLVKHECKEENGDGGQQQTDVVGAEQNAAMALAALSSRPATSCASSAPSASQQLQQTGGQQYQHQQQLILGISGGDFQSLLDSMKDTPTVESFMAMTSHDQIACNYGLLQKTTLLNAQINIVLLEIQAKLEAMRSTDNGTPQPQEDFAATVIKSSEILKSWMERLPLMEVQDFLDFNEMLLEHPDVAKEIENFIRLLMNDRPTLNQQINGMLPHIIGKTLAVNLTFKGRNNKVAYFNTPFLQLLMKCVRGFDQWKDASEKDITKCAKVWMGNGLLRLKNHLAAK